MRELLEQAGFRVRGNRANCVHCEGTSRLTVAFNDSVAYGINEKSVSARKLSQLFRFLRGLPKRRRSLGTVYQVG
jgi:hypothetical protein